MTVYGNWPMFVQFMELWQLIGAEHFYIYYLSMTEQMRQMIEVYLFDFDRNNVHSCSFIPISSP